MIRGKSREPAQLVQRQGVRLLVFQNTDFSGRRFIPLETMVRYLCRVGGMSQRLFPSLLKRFEPAPLRSMRARIKRKSRNLF